MMKQIKHPNIVELVGVCTRQLPFYIITEFMPIGRLDYYLRGPEGMDIETTTLIYMAQQVCSAMSYLASKNIIHRSDIFIRVRGMGRERGGRGDGGRGIRRERDWEGELEGEEGRGSICTAS